MYITYPPETVTGCPWDLSPCSFCAFIIDMQLYFHVKSIVANVYNTLRNGKLIFSVWFSHLQFTLEVAGINVSTQSLIALKFYVCVPFFRGSVNESLLGFTLNPSEFTSNDNSPSYWRTHTTELCTIMKIFPSISYTCIFFCF